MRVNGQMTKRQARANSLGLLETGMTAVGIITRNTERECMYPNWLLT